jgi:hypothetical protein
MKAVRPLAGHIAVAQRYLTSVLANIPTTPVSQVGRFLPDVWAAAPATNSNTNIADHASSTA